MFVVVVAAKNICIFCDNSCTLNPPLSSDSAVSMQGVGPGPGPGRWKTQTVSTDFHHLIDCSTIRLTLSAFPGHLSCVDLDRYGQLVELGWVRGF